MTGLEALDRIKERDYISCDVCDSEWDKYCICCSKHIKNSEELKIIEKNLKAFEFIKERELLEVFKKDNGFTYLRFKGDCYIYEIEIRQQIPQEKYELLKEVL